MTTTPVDEPRPRAVDAPVAAARRETDVLVRRVVLGVAGLYALVVGTLALLRYESFASDFDHGIFSQYVWLLGHLHEPFNTINLRTLLGDHVEPGIALLAPLGTVGVGAPGLLVVQTLALAATAPLLWLLARGARRRGLGRGRAGDPLVRVAGRAAARAARLPPGDARPGAPRRRLRAPRAGAARLVPRHGRDRLRDEGGRRPHVCRARARARLDGPTAARRSGSPSASAAWSAIAVFVVLPAFGNAAENEFGPRFAGVRGNSFADALEFMVRNPLTTVDQALGPAELGILAMLVLTTGGLCLLAPRWLLVAVPAAALNLLSAYDLQHTIQYHYWIVAAGAVAVAGAIGAGRVGAAGTRTWLAWASGSGMPARAALRAVGRRDQPPDPVRVAAPRRSPGDPRRDPRRSARRGADARALAPLRADAPLRPSRAAHSRFASGRSGATRSGSARPRELDYIVFDPAMRFWGAPTVEQVEQEIERRGFVEMMRRGETRLYRREPGS